MNHVVSGIDETSVNRDPDTVKPSKNAQLDELAENIDSSGKPFSWLPRISPQDVYFVYNPDGYYRTR